MKNLIVTSLKLGYSSLGKIKVGKKAYFKTVKTDILKSFFFY